MSVATSVDTAQESALDPSMDWDPPCEYTYGFYFHGPVPPPADWAVWPTATKPCGHPMTTKFLLVCDTCRQGLDRHPMMCMTCFALYNWRSTIDRITRIRGGHD